MQLGGGQLSSTYGVNVPDYILRSWGDLPDSGTGKAKWLLDPCSAVPGTNYWAITDDDVRTVYCCDGTKKL